jgi:FlaG/FlaF family flagellin (archaellin)
MLVAVLMLNKKFSGDVTARSLVIGGHMITLIGVILACVFTLILMLIYVPELFQAAPTGQVLERRPANTNNLIFILLVNAFVANFAAGSFASIILPYTSKRNQKTEQGKDVVNL